MRSTVALLFLLAFSPVAQSAIFEVPLIYDEHEVGFVLIEMVGSEVVAVDGAGLAESLQYRLESGLRERLKNMSMLSAEELQEFGIEISFRPRTMDLVARLSSDVFGTSDISLNTRQPVRGNMVAPASWAFLNNFNVAAEQELNTEDKRANADWLGSLNLGGVRGLNLIWSATGDYISSTETTNLYRGEVTAFHDMPAVPLRLAVGDITTQPRGHLAGSPLGGFSIDTAYYELQPTRRISPGTRQQLVVRERADIEIYINGRGLQRLRLAPGRYDLTDLPLNQGSNEIEVFLFYASGEYEVQRFTQFYNAQLLDPGIVNFSLAGGYRSEFSPDEGIVYSEDSLVSAAIDRGMTRWLTLGANAQHHELGNVVGLSTVLGTPFGSFSFRYSQSEAEGVTGNAASGEWQHRVFGAHRSGAPNLRLAYDNYETFNNTPWLNNRMLDGSRVLASYSAYMGDNIELRFSYQDNRSRDDLVRREGEVRAVYRWRGVRVGGGVRRSNFLMTDSDEYEGFLSIDINIFRPHSGMRYRATYDSYDEQAQLAIAKVSREVTGASAFSLAHVENPLSSTTYGRADYIANRARMGVFSQYENTNSGDSGYAGAQFNTAMGWADGHFGWGRAGTGPFTIVSSHESLQKAPVLVNETPYGPEAIAKPFAGALLTARPRHRGNNLMVNVPDAPIGYDWGSGQHHAGAGAVTGTLITVGSDAYYSVLGVLKDAQGEPIQLQAARLSGEELSMTIFTNSGGVLLQKGCAQGTIQSN
ncbi:hypothetical protein CWE09_13160 [Aliidiomarina minuta]|uniref:Fimbrial biogenesis outer membrane usher protein n=1 Tax=Aliidiomarina minuta TaxID=880057 RepID=A0A432W446_9GAMM|nr:fimbria/pilus outer membrane usher protein [Aliidiomarina minuta]RUO24086.1 hypothetical protein CWE09_13160 [Aliidiomarina minuta]